MHHYMSPTGVAVLLMLALVVDWLSVGPNSIRDRLAFLLALPAIREGFNNGPLDNWTVNALAKLIDSLKAAAAGSYIAGAVTSAIIGAGIGVLAIYTLGCLLPTKASKKLGRFATLTFPTSPMHRINYKLWLCAALLGMLADLPHGLVGELLRAGVDGLDGFVSPLPSFLFGTV
jgi:hypothetical protein